MKTIKNMKMKVFLVAVAAAMLSVMNLAAAPIHDAVKRGDVDAVEEFLQDGADMNARTELQMTPLHTAAIVGHVEVARMLLEHGADVNARDRGQKTPLHWAALPGHLEVAQLLLERGADTTIKNHINQTSADIARSGGRENLVRLIERQLKLNQAFFDASRENNPLKASVFLDYGASPYARDHIGDTPLHKAVKMDSEYLAQRLLEAGADPTIKNNAGETPVDLAAVFSHTILELLTKLARSRKRPREGVEEGPPPKIDD